MREQVRAGECLGSNKDNASSNHCSHGWRLKYPLGKRMWHTRNEDMCHCAEKKDLGCSITMVVQYYYCTHIRLELISNHEKSQGISALNF